MSPTQVVEWPRRHARSLRPGHSGAVDGRWWPRPGRAPARVLDTHPPSARATGRYRRAAGTRTSRSPRDRTCGFGTRPPGWRSRRTPDRPPRQAGSELGDTGPSRRRGIRDRTQARSRSREAPAAPGRTGHPPARRGAVPADDQPSRRRCRDIVAHAESQLPARPHPSIRCLSNQMSPELAPQLRHLSI